MEKNLYLKNFKMLILSFNHFFVLFSVTDSYLVDNFANAKENVVIAGFGGGRNDTNSVAAATTRSHKALYVLLLIFSTAFFRVRLGIN